VIVLLWLALGGALGVAARSGARALAGAVRWGGSCVPARTRRLRLVAAEAAGALVTGALLHLWLWYRITPQGFGLPFAVGTLGGYATSAAFNDETHRGFQEGPWTGALLNLLLSAIVSLGAGLAGLVGARRLFGG
jgi:fluoride ion exporter CrcB/FEX